MCTGKFIWEISQNAEVVKFWNKWTTSVNLALFKVSPKEAQERSFEQSAKIHYQLYWCNNITRLFAAICIYKFFIVFHLFVCRSEKWLHYFWQEFFSTLRIITDFAFIFVLELLRFISHYVVLRVLGGIMIVTGDHFLKPLLAVLFDSIIQPSLVFTRNILAGVKNLLQPLMDITNGFIAQLNSLLRAFRLFELNWKPVYERGQKHDVHIL